MRVPLLDLSDQYRSLAQPIHEAIEAVLASQHFILGPKVEEFEKAIAKYTGARMPSAFPRELMRCWQF